MGGNAVDFIPSVPGSNLTWEIGYLGGVFNGIPQVFQAVTETTEIRV
jgi:hypothetical protein